MLLSMIIVLAIALGGFALTYLIEDDETLLWRLAAGNVIGSAIFGTVSFALASVFGFNAATITIAAVFAVSPILLLTRQKYGRVFSRDRAKANGKLQGPNLKRSAGFFYYAFFFLLFLFFFEQVMYETGQGIFTGGSQNLGDLPFHLGAILGFAEGNNFPPENPSFAGAKFSYPFVADLLTASFVKLGIGIKDAMLVQNVSWALSLLVVLERFVFKLTSDRLASRIAPFLLFFSGGLGFLWFFSDYWAEGKGLFDLLGQLPGDYTISDQFRWGNSMVTLFLTQRSLLLGMPITLIVLQRLWSIYRATKDVDLADRVSFSTFLVGLLAGLLPLIHLHSLAVLFVVCVFLFSLKPDLWKEWMTFAAGVAVIAVPELLWSIAGSATRTSEFLAFHFGWDSGETNFLWFWLKNTGAFIPLLIFGIYMVLSRNSGEPPEAAAELKKKGKRHAKKAERLGSLDPMALLYFYLPFAFLFVIANLARLAPWQWDNIKVLIYWFVGSLPFVAFALAWAWRKSVEWKVLAAVCFVVLIFSGGLDVWRTVSGQVKTRVFDADAVLIAERIRQRTEPKSLFLNAPTYNTAVVLSGRPSLMRYTGHLGSHGIDYREREADVKRIYQGGADAAALLEKYGVDYVLISPEERNSLAANEAFFGRYPVVVEAGAYKVYKVKR